MPPHSVIKFSKNISRPFLTIWIELVFKESFTSQVAFKLYLESHLYRFIESKTICQSSMHLCLLSQVHVTVLASWNLLLVKRLQLMPGQNCRDWNITKKIITTTFVMHALCEKFFNSFPSHRNTRLTGQPISNRLVHVCKNWKQQWGSKLIWKINVQQHISLLKFIFTCVTYQLENMLEISNTSFSVFWSTYRFPTACIRDHFVSWSGWAILESENP